MWNTFESVRFHFFEFLCWHICWSRCEISLSMTKTSKKEDDNKEVENIGPSGKKNNLDLSPQPHGEQEPVAWPSPSPENFFFSRQLPILPPSFLGPCDDGDLLFAL